MVILLHGRAVAFFGGTARVLVVAVHEEFAFEFGQVPEYLESAGGHEAVALLDSGGHAVLGGSEVEPGGTVLFDDAQSIGGRSCDSSWIDDARYPVIGSFDALRMEVWRRVPFFVFAVEIPPFFVGVECAPDSGGCANPWVEGERSWPVARDLEWIDFQDFDIDRIDTSTAEYGDAFRFRISEEWWGRFNLDRHFLPRQMRGFVLPSHAHDVEVVCHPLAKPIGGALDWFFFFDDLRVQCIFVAVAFFFLGAEFIEPSGLGIVYPFFDFGLFAEFGKELHDCSGDP